MYVTRIAPSPTGDFHLGTARTAYFNWLAAKATGGKFILRVDDTDQQRHSEPAVQLIYDSMSWLGLDFDSTFRQSDRKEIYTKLAEDLVVYGLAKFKDGAIWLDLTKIKLPSSWYDTIAGSINLSSKDVESISNLVLLKSDRFPSYHFASVVDDFICNVNFIIRGTDHIPNTPKHIAIYLAIFKMYELQNPAMPSTFSLPKFAHVGLIFKDGKKLSKRDGAASLISYKDSDVDPDALLNFLLRLGWGLK